MDIDYKYIAYGVYKEACKHTSGKYSLHVCQQLNVTMTT